MGRREEEDEYRREVEYEVWRRGGNMDRVDPDRVSDYYDAGIAEDSAAIRELRRQRPPIEQYPEEQFPES